MRAVARREPCEHCAVCYCGEPLDHDAWNAGHVGVPACWSYKTGELQCDCSCHARGWSRVRARAREIIGGWWWRTWAGRRVSAWLARRGPDAYERRL